MDKFKKLIELEKEYDLSGLKKNDLWIYPLIKQNIFVYELSGNKTSLGIKKKSSIITKAIDSIRWALKNKPLEKSDVVILTSSGYRRAKKKGKNNSIYTDFLYDELLGKKILTIEKPQDTGPNHYKNVLTKNIFYPDLQYLLILMKSKFQKTDLKLKENKVFQNLKNFLDLNDKIIPFIDVKYSRFLRLKKYYLKILKKINPKCAIIICAYNYSNMAFISACKDLKIKTIEFQHGFIRDEHPGYIYDQVIDDSLFPDYIFTFGEYFTKLISNSKIPSIPISVGFPFLEEFKNERNVNLPFEIIEKVKGKKVIYITSQWSIRDKLKVFVKELEKIIDEEYIIIYKTHPGEKEIDEFYSDFKALKKIILISDKNINSLEIMKIAYVHTTVYSTSFMEANFFGLPNILIHVNNFSDSVQKFVNNESIFSVSTPKEFCKILTNIYGKKEIRQNELFYTNNSKYRIIESINKLCLTK